MLSLKTTPRYLSRAAQSARTSCLPRIPALCGVPAARTYAHSRFEKPRPGVGRERPKLYPRQPRPEPDSRPEEQGQSWSRTGSTSYESQPSTEQSPLWEQSVRAPSRNPEEGLRRLLQNDRLIITRQLEMLNIFVGLEQTNRYVITNELGDTLGYIAEEPRGFLATLSRQVFRTHRPFRAIVLDADGSPILWIRRPFAFINSRMYVQRLNTDANIQGEELVMDTFAEVQQRWHLWRRRYDLFLRPAPHRILSKADEPQPEPEPDLFHQFAEIDMGLLAWHFTLRDGQGLSIASVNRAFRGFGREIFTDTGQYSVNFTGSEANEGDEVAPKPYLIRDLNVDERALILATAGKSSCISDSPALTSCAVNIDFDYFSRHSGPGGGFFVLGSVE
ncbi:Scramblase-domain-containing protein [Ganoderma leucocontextum]|nr:Scramblase-domain-containing protein [Ganoderma leucocontextum]